LSSQAPGDEPPDVFLYHPADPVPTQGGPLCCNAYFLPNGAFDQRDIEAREDVLVYSTSPLERETGSHRADHRDSLGRHVGDGYRLYGQTRGRV
jgi:predicted acyl esterase